MLEKVIVDLVYSGLSQDDKGSPHKVEITEQSVKCDRLDKFSSYYYNENQRIMRKSDNFAIPKIYVNDKVVDNVNYELMYVVYNSKKYTIKNVLNHKTSSLMVLLDCQEVGK